VIGTRIIAFKHRSIPNIRFGTNTQIEKNTLKHKHHSVRFNVWVSSLKLGKPESEQELGATKHLKKREWVWVCKALKAFTYKILIRHLMRSDIVQPQQASVLCGSNRKRIEERAVALTALIAKQDSSQF
jgi:hypothetical protein